MFKSAATKIAHNTTIPALAGHSDLRPLQDLITAEKTVLTSLQKLRVDLVKAGDALRVWGQGEGDDLSDILSASSTILTHFATALSTYSSLHHPVRDRMKSVRTREEALDELRRRRRRVGASAEAAEKRLHKMSPEHKNLAIQTDTLNKLRDEMQALDGEIIREEAELGDYKRKCTKDWMGFKFGGLVECCEKGVIVGDIGRQIIQSIPEDITQPGLPRAYYNGHGRVDDLVVEAQRAVSQVTFSGNPSGHISTSAPVSQPLFPSLQDPPTPTPFLPTPSLGSEPTLDVATYNPPLGPPVNRRSSVDELGGIHAPSVHPAPQFSWMPTNRDRDPVLASSSVGPMQPLSMPTPYDNWVARTKENQSSMASITDALSQSHRTRRSTLLPCHPPGAPPATVRAWDDRMGQGGNGAHSDRLAPSNADVPSQRLTSSLELNGEELEGLAYDRDSRYFGEEGGGVSGDGKHLEEDTLFAESGGEASVDAVATTYDEQGTIPIQRSVMMGAVSNVEGVSLVRAGSQWRITRAPPPSVDPDTNNVHRPSAHKRQSLYGIGMGAQEDEELWTDESADELARNVAAAREVARATDTLTFSAVAPQLTVTGCITPPPGYASTLQSIDEIANMDVEMHVPLTERWAIIVLDTNILLEFLDTMQTFVSEAEQQQLPVLVIIPGAVIHELDAQKNREDLSWFARRASTWLLKKVKERRSVKGQALDETCKSSGNWKTKKRGEELGTERANDGSILDCCQYFFQIRQCRTFLCSKDKLLAVEAESVGIPTLFPNQGSFCSRDIALAIFGPDASMHQFSGHFPTYRGNVMEDTASVKEMDIDDDSRMTEFYHPRHPLDQLHLQVIDHFSELLLELVAKVAGLEAQDFGAAEMSRHAPAYTRKQLMFWTVSDSLEFLNTKKACPCSSPRLEEFLVRPYTRGARRGQDWSRRDWEVALSTFGMIGDMWAEESCIRGSVLAVEVHMRRVFELAVRPIGVL